MRSMNEKYKKVRCDGWTDGQTKWGVESRSTQLKIMPGALMAQYFTTIIDKTNPDTQLLQSLAGGQGQ